MDSLADVREMLERLEKDGRATHVDPVTHGNAWSVYFKDPEGNGIEIFCDTPWHVAQPQLKRWDPAMSDEELSAWTQAEFSQEAEFGPIDAFYQERERRLAGR